MSYAKGEAANRSQTYNKVWKKGDVKESGTASGAVAKLAASLIKRFGKNAKKKAPNKQVRDAIDKSPKWRNFSEEKANAKAYYDRQVKVPAAEARANAKKRAAAAKRPSAAERKAAEYKASADQIERMMAGYKYSGGSGTRRGRPTR